MESLIKRLQIGKSGLVPFFLHFALFSFIRMAYKEAQEELQVVARETLGESTEITESVDIEVKESVQYESNPEIRKKDKNTLRYLAKTGKTKEITYDMFQSLPQDAQEDYMIMKDLFWKHKIKSCMNKNWKRLQIFMLKTMKDGKRCMVYEMLTYIDLLTHTAQSINNIPSACDFICKYMDVKHGTDLEQLYQNGSLQFLVPSKEFKVEVPFKEIEEDQMIMIKEI